MYQEERGKLQAKIAVILGRVSSKPQEDGYSIDGQINKGRDYCARKGLKVIQEYTFHESSTRGCRPKFFEMIKFIEKQKEPVALICDKVDRLQRSFKEAPIIERLRKSGKLEIHLMTEQQILHQNSTSQELMLYNFFVMMAQNYTDNLSDNINRSHTEMIRQGRVFTKLRVGYKRSESNNKDIIIDDSYAFLIRKLFVEYSTGLYSIDEMCEKAKDWGLINRKTGKPFDRSNIAKILADEFYIGIEIVNKGKKNEVRYNHIYPHLISDELFEKCRKVREGKGHNHSNKSKDMSYNLFKGMIKCKNCGCTVTPEPPKKGKYIYLRPKPKNGCNCKQINETVANKLVEDTLKSMTIPEDVLEMYLDKLKQRFETQQHNEILQQKLKKQDSDNAKKRLERLLDLYLAEDIDIETYKTKKAEIDKEIDLLENQIANFDNNIEEVHISQKYLLEVVSRIYELYASSEIDRKRKILKLVFPNFWLDGRNLSYDIKKPFDEFIKGANCLLNWRIGDSNS